MGKAHYQDTHDSFPAVNQGLGRPYLSMKELSFTPGLNQLKNGSPRKKKPETTMKLHNQGCTVKTIGLQVFAIILPGQYK